MTHPTNSPDVWGWAGKSPEFLARLPVSIVGRESYMRFRPDEERGGFPAAIADVSWPERGVLHVATIAGIVLDNGAASIGPNPAVTSHYRLPELSIAKTRLNGSPTGDAQIEMLNGLTLTVPTPLVTSCRPGRLVCVRGSTRYHAADPRQAERPLSRLGL